MNKATPVQAKAKLKELHDLVKSVLPRAEEGIYYGIPVFKVDGEAVIGIAGYNKFVSLYPMSGSFLDPYRAELAAYKMTKGAISFDLEQPLPTALIKRLVKARLKAGSLRQK